MKHAFQQRVNICTGRYTLPWLAIAYEANDNWPQDNYLKQIASAEKLYWQAIAIAVASAFAIVLTISQLIS